MSRSSATLQPPPSLFEMLNGSEATRQRGLTQALYACLAAREQIAAAHGLEKGMDEEDLAVVGSWMNRVLHEAGLLSLILQGKAGATLDERGEILFVAAPDGRRWLP